MRDICIEVMVPNTMHFFHHIMGEFFPVISIILSQKFTPNTIYIYHPSRKWNRSPFDSFYEDLSTKMGCNVVLTNSAPNIPVIKQDFRFDKISGKNTKDLDPKKSIEYAKDKGLKRVINYLKSLIKDENKTFEIIVQTRANNKSMEDYHKNVLSGNTDKTGKQLIPSPHYGKKRRDVTGYDNITRVLQSSGKKVDQYSGDGDSFFEQLSHYITPTYMTLIHGAGMVWALFLRPGSTIIEISSEHTKDNKDSEYLFQLAELQHKKYLFPCIGDDPRCTYKKSDNIISLEDAKNITRDMFLKETYTHRDRFHKSNPCYDLFLYSCIITLILLVLFLFIKFLVS